MKADTNEYVLDSLKADTNEYVLDSLKADTSEYVLDSLKADTDEYVLDTGACCAGGCACVSRRGSSRLWQEHLSLLMSKAE